MAINLLHELSKFSIVNDRESKVAFFRTHVPSVGSLAYLNVIFKGAPNDALLDSARKLRMPRTLVELLRQQNGACLFSGSLSIYGIHQPGQLLQRSDPLFDLPFNIEVENRNWPPHDPIRFLAFGGYGFDGSRVCINRDDLRIYLFPRGKDRLLSVASHSWQDLDSWLNSEIARLTALFDSDGKRLVDESQTVPSPFIHS